MTEAATWHGRIPWKDLLSVYRLVRRHFFSKERPAGEHIKTDATIAELRETFGVEGFSPEWEKSYYKGEDLNLSYLFYDSSQDDWKQHHLRSWDEGEYRLISCHGELTPEENPKKHLKGVGFTRADGMVKAKAILDRHDIGYTTVKIE